jgi:hypothetical protein
VLGEHAHNIRVVSPGVARKGRQQQLLLKAEVHATLLTPELKGRLPDGLGIDIGRTLQAKSQLKRHVVLARQHSQLVRSPHSPNPTRRVPHPPRRLPPLLRIPLRP